VSVQERIRRLILTASFMIIWLAILLILSQSDKKIEANVTVEGPTLAFSIDDSESSSFSLGEHLRYREYSMIGLVGFSCTSFDSNLVRRCGGSIQPEAIYLRSVAGPVRVASLVVAQRTRMVLRHKDSNSSSGYSHPIVWFFRSDSTDTHTALVVTLACGKNPKIDSLRDSNLSFFASDGAEIHMELAHRPADETFLEELSLSGHGFVALRTYSAVGFMKSSLVSVSPLAPSTYQVTRESVLVAIDPQHVSLSRIGITPRGLRVTFLGELERVQVGQPRNLREGQITWEGIWPPSLLEWLLRDHGIMHNVVVLFFAAFPFIGYIVTELLGFMADRKKAQKEQSRRSTCEKGSA
jgi:hypothetical protein